VRVGRFSGKFQLFLAFDLGGVSKCTQTLQLILHADEVGPPMYKVSEGIRSTRGQDGAIVLDIQHGRILRLNVTGSLIFARLRQGRTESEIINGISEEFRISHDVAQTDVGEFLKSMEIAGLVYRDTSQVRP